MNKTILNQQEQLILRTLQDRFGMNFLTVTGQSGELETFRHEPVYLPESDTWVDPIDTDLFCPISSVTLTNMMLDQDLDIDPYQPHFQGIQFDTCPVSIDDLLKGE